MKYRLAALLWLLAAGPALAQGEGLEDILDEFESEDEVEIEEIEEVEPTWWSVDGAIYSQISYHYDKSVGPSGGDYDGLAVAKTGGWAELDLDLPYDWKARLEGKTFYDWAYLINDRSDFTKRARATSESEAELGEVWAAGEVVQGLDVKFGRQIVNWGRSDTIRVVDILNPLDNREPGLIDVVDLRLPTTMSRVDYHYGPWTLTGIAVHENRRNKNPVFGSEFYPFSINQPPRDSPGDGGSDTEWAASLAGTFSGWDFSVHYARYYNNQQHVAPISGGFIFLVNPMAPTTPNPALATGLVLRQARQTLWGFSSQKALGNFLLKAETAYKRHQAFQELSTIMGLPALTVADKNVYSLFGGVEYSGFNDTTLTLEVANDHIAGFSSNLGGSLAGLSGLGSFGGAERNQTQWVGRVSRDWMNQRLTTTVLASMFGSPADDGGIYRADFDYELRDAVSLMGGIVVYQGGDNPTFEGIRKNDRLFMKVQYSF